MSSKKSNPVFEMVDTTKIANEYLTVLDSDINYSLKVDPEDKYNMTDNEKLFIKYYIEYKNISLSAELANISIDEAKSYYISFGAQEEIRRINKALYQRQFAKKLLTLDEIGGFLSSLITDENVPIADRLKTKEKLEVIKLLFELNKYKLDSINNPEILVTKDIESELKSLSLQSIKSLIETNNTNNDKQDIINELLKNEKMTPEEIAYIKTLDTKDLLNILNKINDKK